MGAPPAAKNELNEIARTCLQEAGGAISKATILMVQKLMTDGRLLRELVAPIVMNVANNRAMTVARYQRQGLFVPRRNAATVARDAAAGHVAAVSRMILHIPLPFGDGMKLIEASRAQVITAIEFYEKTGSTMLRRARWLRLIVQSVPDGKIVGDCVTDERAIELWNESENG